MKNKKGFLLRDVAISALFGVGVIALFVIVIGSMSSNYNRNDIVDAKFAEHYDQLNRLTSSIDTSRNSVSNSSSGTSLTGDIGVTFNSFWTVVKTIWTSLDIFGETSANIVSDYTFLNPDVIKILFVILVSALTTYIIFVIISSVTRGRV